MESIFVFNRTMLVLGLLLCFILLRAWQALRDPLRNVPGPFLARFTRLWELHAIRQPSFEKRHLELHQRYGI